MRIVITDTGLVWNQNNPFLEKYKEIVLVVCLDGKAVTDKYQCFVSPYCADTDIVMGMDRYGIEDRRFQRLASVGGKLNAQLNYHDKIVFLTDNIPSTLYPFYVVKEWNRYNSLHLVAMPPWKLESSHRKKEYYDMMSDLSGLQSVLCYDGDKALERLKDNAGTAMPKALDYFINDLGKMMPRFLNGIYDMNSGPCFFDFASMTYIPLKSGLDETALSENSVTADDVKFSITREYHIMGKVRRPMYPEDNERTKEAVERPTARLDGKKVCNMLREQRIKLAKANNIPFESEECPAIGPCAGTCEKCDAESEYLRNQLWKIPEKQRVYPQFDPREEVRE